MRKHALAGLLAASLVLTPSLALADGIDNNSVLQLQPLGAYHPVQSNDAVNIRTTPYNTYGTYGGNTTLQGRVSTIPQGTMLMIKIDQPISSFSSNLGDTISATLENDIFVNDSIAIPAGSQVIGQVANVTNSSRLGRHGEIDVRFHSVKTPDGQMIPIRAHVVTTDQTGILKGNTYTQDLLKGIGYAAGGTAAGTLMGTAAGSLLGSVGTGAVVGLSMGAMGGMGYAMMRKGKDVVIPSDSRLSIIVDHPVNVGQ